MQERKTVIHIYFLQSTPHRIPALIGTRFNKICCNFQNDLRMELNEKYRPETK